MRLVSGATNAYLHIVAFSTSDHITRVTGLTAFNVYATASSASTGSTYGITVNEVNSTQMPGVYRLLLNDSTLMAVGSGFDSKEVCLHITSSMDPVTRTFELYRRTATTGATLTVNSSGEPTNVMTMLTSVNTNVNTAVTKVTSIDTNATSILNKVTSIEANTTSLITGVNAVKINGSSTAAANLKTAYDTNFATVYDSTNNTFRGGAATITTSNMNDIADTFLNRDMSTGIDSGSSVVRTPRQALRFLRNRWNVSGTTLTVYKEDDATASWISVLTGTSGANPVTASDPEGP